MVKIVTVRTCRRCSSHRYCLMAVSAWKRDEKTRSWEFCPFPQVACVPQNGADRPGPRGPALRHILTILSIIAYAPEKFQRESFILLILSPLFLIQTSIVYKFPPFFLEDLTVPLRHDSIRTKLNRWIEARVVSVPHSKAGWPPWAKGRTAEVGEAHPDLSCWVVRKYLPDCHKTL